MRDHCCISNRQLVGYCMSIVRVSLLSALVSIVSYSVYAEYRQHGAHVHGEGELLIVLENENLEMSFRIPAMDLIGFEHAARTKAQQESIQNTKTYLRKADQVVVLTGSPECTLHRSSALFALTEHDHPDEKEEERQQDGQVSEHAEFHVKYIYRCSRPEELESIVFSIFEKYGEIEKVKSALIVSSEQSAVTLTPEEPEVRIKKCRFSIGSWCLL